MAKSGIALLLAPKGKGGEMDDEEDKDKETESDEDEGGDGDEGGNDDEHGEAAAAKFAVSLKIGDHAGMWDAMKTMCKLCEDYEEPTTEEPDESEEK